MKFKKLSILLISCLFFMNISSADAAVKAGSVCKNLGATFENLGKVFTCNKSGKKLTWSKGTELDLNWYGWDFRINSKGILERKEGLFGNWSSSPTRPGQLIDPIRLKAFNEIKKYSLEQQKTAKDYSINFSPNVDIGVRNTLRAYFNESIAFFQSKIPSNARLETVISTEKDDDYLKSKILEIDNSQYGYEIYLRVKTLFDQFKNENPLRSSGGGTVGTTSKPGVLLYVGAVCSCFKSENILMYNIPHEVTHFYQGAATPSVLPQTIETVNGERKEKVYIPLSLGEGAANTLGSALTVKYVGWYSDQMDWHVGRLKSRAFLTEISSKEDAVKLLFDADSFIRKSTEDPELSYILGQLQYEFYIAKYGMNAFFDLYNNIERSGDFDSAIAKTIGKSKLEFYGESAEYVMSAFNRVKD